MPNIAAPHGHLVRKSGVSIIYRSVLRFRDHLKDVYQSDKASGKKRKRDWADSMMADEQSAAEASCARWISAAALPLSTTEHPAFKEFMRVLRPSFKTPSRYLIGHTLLRKEYESLGG